MPYFYNKYINLLFIHIPKTGGTSIEKFLSKKYNIPLNDQSLFNAGKQFNGVSYQHQTYKSIINNLDIFKIELNNLKILTVVRCPYNRIISDLFHFKYITVNSTPEYVFKILISRYFNNFGANDNHKKPQYLFLLDNNNKILENIIILKMETLKEDMNKLGFIKFNSNENSSYVKRNYMSFLNSDSIKLINIVYKQDFLHFNYPIINNK